MGGLRQVMWCIVHPLVTMAKVCRVILLVAIVEVGI